MLHFGKIPKEFGQHLARFSKILTKFAKFWKNQQTFQRFFTKHLRLENGAKEIEQTPWNIMEGFLKLRKSEKRNVYQKHRKKETLVLSSYSINIHMHLTSSSTGNHQSVLCFVFVGILHLARGGSTE